MEQLQDRGPDISPAGACGDQNRMDGKYWTDIRGYTDTQLHMNANVAPCLLYKCETICYSILQCYVC